MLPLHASSFSLTPVSGFSRINVAVCVTLLGHYYFVHVVLVIMDPYIQPLCRATRNQVGAHLSLPAISYPFLHFPAVTLFLLTIFDHPLNEISRLILFYRNMCNLTS